MLIYVIPLVILIIVLIVFKKRQDAQESDKAKTKTVKAKKTGSASKAAPQRTKVVEPVGVTKKSATPLSAETFYLSATTTYPSSSYYSYLQRLV